MMREKTEPRVSVVIPCHNEEGNIPVLARQVEEVFEGLPEYPYECLFVDDGSTDGTREQLRLLALEKPRVRPLHLVCHMGQSAALVAGMQSARGAYILTLDGDLQNDPSDFPRFLGLLQDYDCVCGYRIDRRDTWRRRFASSVGNAVFDWLLHGGIRDYGCGIKGFRRACVDFIVPFDGVHRFLPVLIRNAGLSIVECPVNHRLRRHGQSKYGFRNRFWHVLSDLAGVAWLRRRVVCPRIEEENPSGIDSGRHEA